MPRVGWLPLAFEVSGRDLRLVAFHLVKGTLLLLGKKDLLKGMKKCKDVRAADATQGHFGLPRAMEH